MFGPEVCFAFSNRAQGNMSLVYGATENSLDNRRDFLNTLNIDYRNLVSAKQVHGNHVRHVSKQDRGRGALSYEDALEATDALVTDEKNLPIAIFTADCLPVFLGDPVNAVIALIHAGWRTSAKNIAAKTVRYMQDNFHAEPKNIQAYFGPAIRSCCYEVNAQLEEFFPQELISRGAKLYLDLPEVNRKQLLGAGLQDKNISGHTRCTFCNNADFFSFRREGNSCARMMSVMMLR